MIESMSSKITCTWPPSMISGAAIGRVLHPDAGHRCYCWSTAGRCNDRHGDVSQIMKKG